VEKEYSSRRKFIDGAYRRLVNYEEDQKENIFLVFGKMERMPNRRCQLGKKRGYPEAWKVNALDHGKDSMNVSARGL